MKPRTLTRTWRLCLGAALAAGSLSWSACAGELLPPFRVEANGKPIDMELGNAAPFITDFDGDGVFDLMLGQRGECKLRIYRNTGSNKEPKFGVSAFFKAGGMDASLPGGWGAGGFCPHGVDYDADGRMDFLTGSISGKVYLYRRKPNGTFALPEVLKQEVRGLIGAGDAPINLGSASAVAMADWFGQGKLDLFVGTGDGYVYLARNEGTRQKPLFRRTERLKADGKLVVADSGMAGPFVADWDDDGKLDLLVGCGSGRVVWYRNIGTKDQPQLAAGITLVEPYASKSQTGTTKPTRSGLNAKVCVADWNGDGRPDLIVGDYVYGSGTHGWVWAYLRAPAQTAQMETK